MNALVFYTDQGGITTAGILALVIFLLALFLMWGDFGGSA